MSSWSTFEKRLAVVVMRFLCNEPWAGISQELAIDVRLAQDIYYRAMNRANGRGIRDILYCVRDFAMFDDEPREDATGQANAPVRDPGQDEFYMPTHDNGPFAQYGCRS